MKKNKILTILVVGMMLFNFLSYPILTVKAISNNEVENYITLVDTKITNTTASLEVIDTDTVGSIKAKQLLKEELVKLVDSYNLKKEELDKGISLEEIINKSNDNTLKDKYLEYQTLGNPNKTLSINSLEDITYEKETKEEVLITKQQQENLIITNYLDDISSKINDFVNTYTSRLNDLTTKYDNLSNDVETLINSISNYILELENYEKDEISKGNTPNLELDKKDVYTILDDLIENLSTLKDNLDLENYSKNEKEYNKLIASFNTTKTSILANNKTYQELGLDTKIGELDTKYKALDNTTTNYTLDENLVENIKEGLELDKEYQTLNNLIDTYLSRKQSDKNTLNTLKENLDNTYEKLSKDKLLTLIEKIVNDTDKTNEDNVDVLYGFLSINELKEETKNKIVNAKLELYDLVIDDYETVIKDNIIYINTTTSISVDDFKTKVTLTNGSITFNTTNTLVDNTLKLNLLDKNNALITTYSILLKGDLNGDGLLDSKDADLFTSLLLDNKATNKELLDINSDNKIDIKDLVALEDIYNTNTKEEATKAKLRLVRRDNKNTIYYDLYLDTDKTIRSINLTALSSSDLDYKKFTSNYNIKVKVSNKNISLLGLDTFEDGLVGTFTFNKNNKELSQTTLTLNKVKVMLNTTTLKEMDRVVNIYVNEVKEEENTNTSSVVRVNNNVDNSSNIENNIKTDEEEKPNDNKKDDDKEIEVKPNEVKEEEPFDWWNIVKIIVVIILGALIIYFLNKKDEEEEEKKKLEEFNKK